MKNISIKYLLIFFCMLIPDISLASVAEVKKDNQFSTQSNEDKAVLAVYQAIRKNNLSKLRDQCLAYEFSDSADADFFIVDVRENKRYAICGGDSDTSVHLFRFKMNKKDFSLSTDAGSVDGTFHKLKR
ncbi:hypothetical protein [Winslowiella iniecta]|uniref:hypothetical protein n=1 Tax=Winslowiella iniecta TaxID=1560201 RepID=UPI00069E1712|nr:hypothetical protein [Winslowiella iniecta]